MGPIAGIDIGTVSITLVLLDSRGQLTYRDYSFHRGNIYTTLETMLGKLPAQQPSVFGVVAEKGREFFRAGVEVNEQVALIAGVKHFVPNPGAIIVIGGETFGLILFDRQGHYHKYITNSACAAGTGSFLDQQASRLGLSGSGELSRIGEGYQGDPPRIATRCAVFARTDLVHMQQQGYGLPAIAAGLARGVAQNIYDTLFHGIELLDPVVVAGGVSKNRKVLQYLQEAVGRPLQALPDGEYIGAIGAALIASMKQNEGEALPAVPAHALLERTTGAYRSYGYPPLSSVVSEVPDFHSWESSVTDDVEIDVYEPPISGEETPCYLGIDIGSTSTKATLMNREKAVLAGLYTRTGGQPISAVQKLTKAIAGLEHRFSVHFRILAAGTTGSGRKFIQKVVRADYAVDEITAHARAAYHLAPETDTIIEIGGQDAKFTVLKDGSVTFSVMNYVCAAGTGSFIEEQASRLGVSLQEYAALALGASAPLISDRCTVFMERDLNHLLSLQYSREELLAAALHSVRDNYLSKVAHINKIGSRITFQGATAKNYALVKAFEQKLQKSITVSKFCHLTGAFGVCLKMADADLARASRFRKDLHAEQVKVDEYVCEYCKNHCKIKSIDLEGETLGWGYLCGRDERDPGYRKKVTSGFDLLRSHRKVFDVPAAAGAPNLEAEGNPFREFKDGGIRSVARRPGFSLARLRNHVHFNLLELRREIFSSGIAPRQRLGADSALKIGLPATLTMIEYLPLWELFFKRLGFLPVVTSSDPPHITSGKEIAGAEYCTPLVEFHGHIRNLIPQVDFIFYPQLFEDASGKEAKSYCYYSHYAVPVVHNIPSLPLAGKVIAPVLAMNGNLDEMIRQIYLGFPEAMKEQASFDRVERAFSLAWEWFQERKKDLQELFRDQVGATNDIAVALMGRPYLILNQSLNKGIPDRLAEKGIQSFYMDMIPVDEREIDAARDFVRLNHWHYGNRIIRTAEIVAKTKGLFSIYLTAFKCSPDSFILSYFKDIMDYYRKPYLILQLDEHEAGEGYDTRLEAAIETFRNFREAATQKTRPRIDLKRSFADKTYLLSDYDHLNSRLLQAILHRSGIKAELIAQTPETISRSIQLNDGQCLPISILTQGILHTIQTRSLRPEQVAIFCNADSRLSCNLPQYPVMLKQTLTKMGHGLEQVEVRVSPYLPTDLPLELLVDLYRAWLISGLLQKITHQVRPREKTAGATDRLIQKAERSLFAAFRKGTSKEEVFQEIVRDLEAIEVTNARLPQVGIVGDIYVRDNEVFNQDLIRRLERAGAEAVTIPFIDTMGLLVTTYFKSQWLDGSYLGLLRDKALYGTLGLLGRKLTRIARPLLKEEGATLDHDPLTYLQHHSLSIRHGGETSENLLKVYYLHENYPDLKFIVHVYPLFCCPGLISEAIYKKVERDLAIPIVSIAYDGTQADKNKILEPYLRISNSPQ
jgi:predicted CoA-substrate-specific enzyme activase